MVRCVYICVYKQHKLWYMVGNKFNLECIQLFIFLLYCNVNKIRRSVYMLQGIFDFRVTIVTLGQL